MLASGLLAVFAPLSYVEFCAYNGSMAAVFNLMLEPNLDSFKDGSGH